MKKASSRRKRINSLAACTQKTFLPLFAVGGSLAVAPAYGIELGEATVQSRLGQPLRASIAFALAPKEQLSEACISLGVGQSGLPGIGRATISIADGALLLNGSTPVREPLVAANVVINCPSAAKLAREYMMFIDPAGSAVDASPVAQDVPLTQPVQAPVSKPTRTTQTTPAGTPLVTSPSRRTAEAPTRRAAAASSRQPIGKSTRYRVQPGDSLSEITERVENRRMGLWAAVNVIFEANPAAFIDNDPNKLKAGSWLTIPSFDGSQPVVAATATEVATATAAALPEIASDFVPVDLAQPESTVATAREASPESGQSPAPGDDATADLQPGALEPATDASLTEVPVADGETIAIPDTALLGPQTRSTSPNVATATVQPRSEQRTSSWLWWLAGSGAAIILALLLFGRTLRGRFGSTPFDVANELPMPDASVEDDALAPRAAVDYDINDDEPTAENPTLDADLIMGTGLNVNTNAGATEDVGLPSPTAVDIELPFASDDMATDSVDKTMQSAAMVVDETILDSEILPDSDDYPDAEDFDMSVILDVTKMPRPDDVTQPDLEAIEQESTLEFTAVQPADVASDLDLTILEQDYEDEFSATMAVKMELTQTAEKLVHDMDLGDIDGDEITVDDDSTAAMSLASLSEYDVKSHAAADNDADAVTHEELTLQLAGEEATLEMPIVDEDRTRKMPARNAKLKKKAG